MDEKNALAELAEGFDMFIATMNCYVDGKDETMLNKIKRIIAELVKIEKPIDRSKVRPSIDGMVHLSDIVKADKERCLEVMRNCRAIAEEGVNNGK